MSTTRLFVEAVDTTGRLADALTNWIIFLAVTAAILALAAVACGAWAVNVAWGRLYDRWRRAGGPGVESAATDPERHREALTAFMGPRTTHQPPGGSVKPYRLLVTGSRDWDDVRTLRGALNDVLTALPNLATPVIVVHGDCPNGADRQASVWVRDAQGGPLFVVTEEKHPANWQLEGKRAGFIRNARMVNLGADLCLAFIRNGSRGASHTARLAEEAGIPVRRFTA